VKTLYRGSFDPRLREQIQQRYRHLLEGPETNWEFLTHWT
jgi:hypothetical protein